MKVEEINFSFAYRKKQIEANCSKVKPMKVFQYRVFIPSVKEEDEVYIFYEIKEEKKLFWFDLPDQEKQGKAKAIASCLEQMIFAD